MTTEHTVPAGSETAPIIGSPEEITADWMAAALGTRVTGVEYAPVGTGQLGTGILVDVTESGADGAGATHRRLFVKLPTADVGMRPFVHGVYRSEVVYYRDLAPTLAVRSPRCHYAAIGDEGTGEFTLVLDDAAPLVQADQITGLTPAQARDCAVNLAGLHGPRWCDPTLGEIPGLPRPTEEDNNALDEMAGPTVEAFLAELGDRLSDEERAVCEELPTLVGRWANGRPERFAPIHQDFRADNMLVDPAGERPSLAVDFQTLTIGLPGRDLGFLLSTSLTGEDRRAHEDEIIAAYHEALLGHGVTDYDLDTCRDDYVFGLLQGPVIGTFGWLYGSPTERGDEMFVTMMRRAARAMHDHDALSVVRGG